VKIIIETIPNNAQNYNTCGNYRVNTDGSIYVTVSEMKEEYEWFVIIHELVEIFLCKMQGVNFSSIDEFDLTFEAKRKNGLYPDEDEPGDALNAPYRNQHCIATSIERMLCGMLGISWSEYEKHCVELTASYKKE
jgi:hypothetical protein